jgi:hypothetical protein
MNRTKRFLQFGLAGLLSTAAMTATASLAIHILPMAISLISGLCAHSCKPLAFGILGISMLVVGILASGLYLHYFMKVTAVSAAAITVVGYFSTHFVTTYLARHSPPSMLLMPYLSLALTALSFAWHGLLFDTIKTEKGAAITGIALALAYVFLFFL